MKRIAYLRRKPRHLVEVDEPITLCGYRIPVAARWRIRRPGKRSGSWVSCDTCKRAARAIHEADV